MTGLTLDAIRLLDAIDREGGLNRAAEILHKVPSTLSHALQKLEEDLGIALYHRQRGRLHLTEAGQELVTRGRALLADSATLEEDIKRISAGWERSLRVAVADIVPMDWVARQVDRVFAEAPHTRITLSRETLAGSWDALCDGRADLAVGAPYTPPPGQPLSSRSLGQVALVIALHPDHPLAHVPSPLPHSLTARHRVALVADSSQGLPPLDLDDAGSRPALTVPDLATKREVILAGLAYGTLPWHLIEADVSAGRLCVKAPPTELGEPVHLAWRDNASGRALTCLRDALLAAPRDWMGEPVV